MKRAAIASIAIAFAFAACTAPTGTPGASPSGFAFGSASPASSAAASPLASASAAASASAGAVSSPLASGSPSAISSPGASSSAGAFTSPAATSSSAATSAAGAASATTCARTLQSGQAGASSVAVDVGTLIDRSDAESVIGTLTGTPARVEMPLVGFILSACVYESSDGSLAVATGPSSISKSDFEGLMKLVPNATAVSGVGDSAFAFKATPPTGITGAASIFVLSGNTYFTLQATSKTKTSDSLLTSLQAIASKAAKKL